MPFLSGDVALRKRTGGESMRNEIISHDLQTGWAKAALIAASFAAFGAFATAASADEIQRLQDIGDGYKSVAVITHYEVKPEKRLFDLTAAEPNDSSISRATKVKLAARTANAICSGGRVQGAWTVQIFLPGESSPAASCRAGGHKRHAR